MDGPAERPLDAYMASYRDLKTRMKLMEHTELLPKLYFQSSQISLFFCLLTGRLRNQRLTRNTMHKSLLVGRKAEAVHTDGQTHQETDKPAY